MSVSILDRWSDRLWTLFAGVIGFVLAYIAGAELGHWLSLPQSHIATVWPPSGLYLVVLLRSSRRHWPALGLAALASNLISDVLLHSQPVPVSLGFAATNTLEAFVAASLLRRFFGTPFRFDRLNAVLGLTLISALVGAVLGATAGAATVTLAFGAPFWSMWRVWWTADVVGVWIVASLLLTLWPDGHRRPLQISGVAPLAEGGMLLAGLGIMAFLLFLSGYTFFSVPSLILPVLLWAALRFGLLGVSVVLALLMLITISVTISGYGPFIRPELSPEQTVILAQLFLCICALCFLPLAALMEERRRAVDALRAANDELERRVQRRTAALEETAERQRLAVQAAERTLVELREVTALLDAIFARAPIGLGFWDRNLRFVRVNERLAEMNGLPAEAHPGKTPLELFPGLTNLEQLMADWRRMLATGEPLLDIEVSGETPAMPGQLRYWRESFFPVQVGEDIVGLSAVVEDITERKAAEQALHEARAAADAANQAKSAFLANMSHEIRTPMSAILGYADILAARLQDPDDLQSVNVIQRNGRHLLDLINDILDLSKIEAGSLELVRERFAPDRLIADIHSLMLLRAQEKGLTLTVEFVGPLPATIDSGPRRLRQILINLLGNAIKFTQQGGVTLRVQLREDGPEPRLQFTVIDTGIGIQPTQLSKLFQPFSQIDSSITREHGGSGLGLAISQRLAQLLDGEITVESQPGKGSTFTVTVPTGPLTDVERIAPRLEVTAAPLTTTPKIRLSGRILVVDDRHEIRYLAQRYLEEAGAEVELAADGWAALTAVATAEAEGRPFTAVVLDMQMPGLDGYTVVRRLRARGFTRPILALTAHTMKGDREKCIAAGCDEYLGKPIERDQFLALLARLIQMRSPALANPVPATVPACRALVVDDNEDAANSLAIMLQLLGYEAATAYSGRTALAAAHEQRPDVIILDINLPDLDGYTVVRQLKREPQFQQTVFIALSGQDGADEQIHKAGFDHHLLKPAGVQELVELFPRRVQGDR
ncbi:MAG: response regulator [Candidatus Competibacteraceae bacterium]